MTKQDARTGNTETEQYQELTDRELVGLLLRDDSGAWNYLCTEVIAPMTRIRKYNEIFARFSLSLEAVVSQVFLDLHESDFSQLRDFRFDGSIEAWLFFQIRGSVKTILRQSLGKNKKYLSETELDDSLSTDEKLLVNFLERKMDREVAAKCLEQLWKSNPMKAYVLMLRMGNGLSSKEVGSMLDQRGSNVDQLLRRAKKEMINYRKKVK